MSTSEVGLWPATIIMMYCYRSLFHILKLPADNLNPLYIPCSTVYSATKFSATLRSRVYVLLTSHYLDFSYINGQCQSHSGELLTCVLRFY